jgi:Domain of unknown function (DUF4279)
VDETTGQGSATPISSRGGLARVGGVIDKTTVTLAIYGADLEPDEITAILGCAPTHAHRRGAPGAPNRLPWSSGAWLLAVEGGVACSTEALLLSLLERLPQDPGPWAQIRKRFELRISLGLFLYDVNRGFILSPACLQRLLVTGATLWFDIYANLDLG